jgi:hypothetical protein
MGRGLGDGMRGFKEALSSPAQVSEVPANVTESLGSGDASV